MGRHEASSSETYSKFYSVDKVHIASQRLMSLALSAGAAPTQVLRDLGFIAFAAVNLLHSSQMLGVVHGAHWWYVANLPGDPWTGFQRCHPSSCPHSFGHGLFIRAYTKGKRYSEYDSLPTGITDPSVILSLIHI